MRRIMRTKAGLKLGFLTLILAGFSTLAAAAGLPDIKGKDLKGADFDLLQAIAQKPTLVVVGFSKASGDRCKVWEKALWADAGTDTRVAIVSLVMLNKAPGFVRPMIRHAIRKGTPVERHSSVIIVTEEAKGWEQNFALDLKADPDACFVLLLSATGEVNCKVAGAFDPAKLSLLKDCVHAH
jgi:hypothetical protein